MRGNSLLRNKRILLFARVFILVTFILLGLVLLVNTAGAADVEYIYFDLSAGNVSISGNSYTGYAYQKNDDNSFTTVTLSGTLGENQAYYVYQSKGIETSSPDGYFVLGTDGEKNYTLPTRAKVTHNGKTWQEYITNNTDVEGVIAAWIAFSGRTATSNRIAVSGTLDATLVIDNLYSKYISAAATGRTDGGLSFVPQGKSQLRVELVGDNRFGNVFYGTNSDNQQIVFDEKEKNATLTVANIASKSKQNYWCSAIGASDNTRENAKGIVIEGGTIYAGTNAGDDCTAIGAGGNGYGLVTIKGGTVTAVTSSSGAAIGGGIGKTSKGGSASVTISGGTVYAYNFSCSSGSYSKLGVAYIPSAAIGGGSSARETCNSSTITITGGKVFAQSVGGTAIGGGSSSDNTGGSSTVVIGGNAYVEAKSIAGTISGNAVSAGVSIGGGTGGKGANKNGGDVTLTIKENATVVAGSIGGGKTISSSGGKIGAATVTVTGGSIKGQIVMAQGSSTQCTFTMSGGTIDNSGRDASFVFLEENGGAIYMDDQRGQATVSGGKITNCSSKNGGAIYMSAGIFTLSGEGSISNCSATENGGAICLDGDSGEANILGGSVSGCSAVQGGAIYMGGGTLSMSGGEATYNNADNGGAIYLYDGNATISGGSITDCHATENGGAIYMGGGTLSMSDGEVSSCDAVNGGAAYLKLGNMSVSGGSINNNEASDDGGALYLGGGELTVSKGEISYNSAINGGGAFVANGDATVTGGVIYKNTASGNGGGIDISNGNFIMSGGSIDGNVATNGDGGAIYVSSSQNNSVITVSSGSIINNYAGGNGGALGVHGQDGITFTITIGKNTNHEGFENAHECENSDATEHCPIIKNNEAVTSGGGIYLSGSYEAKMNIYCLIEDGNEAEGGVSRSNFMEVQGGTLTISTLSDDGTGDYGNVVINSTVHVNGGKVTLEGTGDSPHFNGSVYVDVNEAEGSTFLDGRTERSSYTVQYFENFGEGADRSGEYILVDVPAGTTHFVQANSYSNVGFEFKHWVLMERDENNKLQETSETYAPGKDVTVNKNLIFHAKWFAVGYTVIFKPGTEEFENTMEPQTFLYTDTTKALTLNNFVYPGFSFVKWIDEDTGDVYTNGQILATPIRTEDGAVVNLVAEWTTCYHTDMGSYHISNPSDNIMLRECPCGGYNETATLLGGINTVYDESKVHTASVSYYTYSVNSHYPSDTWSFEIKYSGNNWENVPFDEENLVPQNAGKYKASIEFNGYTAFVEIVIEKAEQAAPGIPQYEAQTLDGKTTLIITETTFIPGLEYLFTWYDDIEGVYMYDGWNKWTDEANPPSCPLDRIYTNYYVDVRYAETENYKASPAVRGETVIMHTGGVIFRITCAAASGITQMTDEDSSAESGVTVNLIPLDINLYYIYNVTYEMYSDYTGYVLPEISYDDISGEHWIARITKIQNAPDDVESVTIYITFSGAELIPTVEASTDKGENFDGALGGLGDDVYVSRDSAYTAEFKIGNYKHYGAASLVFSHSLPIGTTVIMIDENDGSYYSYVISSEAASIPISSNFVRMGSNEAYPSFPPESERLNFRFIIDFSRCESYIAASELTASFYAVPIYPSDDVKTVPNLPTGVGAIATVKLVNVPTFDLYVSLDSTDSLTKNLTCKYAESQNTAAGISRWEARRGILVITPSDLSALPPDTRLRVKITNKTNTYYLSDGKYIIPLTSVGTDDVSITLVSDMIPNENADFVFSVKMFSSYTRATTSPDEEIANLLPITLTYKVSEVPEPELHAELDGALPEYKDGAISKAELKVLLKGLPEGYSVKAVVYVKDKASGRYIAAQTTDLTSYFENSETEISATLEFNSLLDRMSAEIGSLSIMARVEIIDQNEKTLTYVPVYFILKDTRQ
ncbi:MAG: hypothetical protein IJY23_06805 [Clostridia bacterium]|nr:hypothetical protein [Clostridia bacterium]